MRGGRGKKTDIFWLSGEREKKKPRYEDEGKEGQKNTGIFRMRGGRDEKHRYYEDGGRDGQKTQVFSG